MLVNKYLRAPCFKFKFSACGCVCVFIFIRPNIFHFFVTFFPNLFFLKEPRLTSPACYSSMQKTMKNYQTIPHPILPTKKSNFLKEKASKGKKCVCVGGGWLACGSESFSAFWNMSLAFVDRLRGRMWEVYKISESMENSNRIFVNWGLHLFPLNYVEYAHILHNGFLLSKYRNTGALPIH